MTKTRPWSELAAAVPTRIDLVVVTNGRRDCISETIPSAVKHLHLTFDRDFTNKVIIDDSSAEHQYDYEVFLDELCGIGWEVRHTAGATGFDGAYRTVWDYCRNTDSKYVFVLEDDFTFNHDIDVSGMMLTLDLNPHLAQLALVRQPWNDRERMAGGVREQWPDAYVADEIAGVGRWLEHQINFTTNPFVARTELMKTGPDWPTGSESEGRYGFELRKYGFDDVNGDEVRFAYWGWMQDGPQVEHIGHKRVGSGY